MVADDSDDDAPLVPNLGHVPDEGTGNDGEKNEPITGKLGDAITGKLKDVIDEAPSGKKKGAMDGKSKGILRARLHRKTTRLDFKSYGLWSIRNKLQSRTRMSEQYANLVQDMAMDIVDRICRESLRLLQKTKRERVSLSEVSAAIKLVIGRNELSDTCIAKGAHGVKEAMKQEKEGKLAPNEPSKPSSEQPAPERLQASEPSVPAKHVEEGTCAPGASASKPVRFSAKNMAKLRKYLPAKKSKTAKRNPHTFLTQAGFRHNLKTHSDIEISKAVPAFLQGAMQELIDDVMSKSNQAATMELTARRKLDAVARLQPKHINYLKSYATYNDLLKGAHFRSAWASSSVAESKGSSAITPASAPVRAVEAGARRSKLLEQKYHLKKRTKPQEVQSLKSSEGTPSERTPSERIPSEGTPSLGNSPGKRLKTKQPHSSVETKAHPFERGSGYSAPAPRQDIVAKAVFPEARAFEISERVEMRDGATAWSIGKVTSLNPLKVRGFQWDEVRKLENEEAANPPARTRTRVATAPKQRIVAKVGAPEVEGW